MHKSVHICMRKNVLFKMNFNKLVFIMINQYVTCVRIFGSYVIGAKIGY